MEGTGTPRETEDLAPQVTRTEAFRPDLERFRKGLLLFGLGLAMSSIDVWIAAYLFAFQIYYDFSAYSDMALGIGHFFGYDLTRNFDTPYLSQNPVEFWKRWHVTPSSWIRDYLYIPMGGSRKGLMRGIAALIASMCISGLWHGASWSFVLWGLYHGVLSAVHRIWRRTAGKRVKPGVFVQVLNTFVFFQLTVIGWVFFRVTEERQLWPLLQRMLTFSQPGAGPHLMAYAALILGLYCLHAFEYALQRHFLILWSWWQQRVPAPVRGIAYGAVIMMLWLFLRPQANAFIYSQF